MLYDRLLYKTRVEMRQIGENEDKLHQNSLSFKFVFNIVKSHRDGNLPTLAVRKINIAGSDFYLDKKSLRKFRSIQNLWGKKIQVNKVMVNKFHMVAKKTLHSHDHAMTRS